MKNEKIVALFDIHVPFNIDLKPIWKFIKDFEPDKIILGGDIHDFDVVNPFSRNGDISLDGRSIKKMFDELNTIVFKPLLSVKPKRAEIIYLQGNHEHRINRAIESDRKGYGYWEIKNNIPSEISLYPVNYPYRVLDHLIYTHGGEASGEHHAKRMVMNYHASVFYGHTHDVQLYTAVSPIDSSKVYKAQSCGCLSHTNPCYLLNKPNRYVNAFHICIVDHDKQRFHDTLIHVVFGHFWALGRWY